MNNQKNNFKNIRSTIFDLDGTLLDSYETHFNIYKEMLSEFGIGFSKDDFIKYFKPDWYRLYESVGLKKEFWNAANDSWVRISAKYENNLFPGARDLLFKLKNEFKLGLVTSGQRDRVERDLLRSGISGLFDIIVTAEDVGKAKPDPEGLNRALLKLECPADKAVYIGDTIDDFYMANSAGVKFIGVKSNFIRPNNHEFYLIERISDLLILLNNQNQGSQE